MQQAQRAGVAGAGAPDFATLRETMVERQIRTFDVSDLRVVARFREVAREKFVAPAQAPIAYSDLEVRLPSADGGRSMLAPLVAARALQALEIAPSDRAMIVGDGAGYLAAIVAGLASSVISLESDDLLSKDAAAALTGLGDTATAVRGPLRAGAKDHGPYDVILVAGGVEEGLDALFAQLRDEGRLLAFHPQAGAAARATLYRKVDGGLFPRNVFEAQARLLPEFRKPAAFSF